MEKLTLHSYSNLMNTSFERICEGKHYNSSFEPYTEEFIIKMIDFFEREEEYEKCGKIADFQKKRFNHEKNYLLDLK